jgi:hypothetical protein
MIAVLDTNFCPDTFSNAFVALLSLINNKQDEECIHQFWARFEGHLHNISWSMVSIPPNSSGHALLTGMPSLLKSNH